jgi:hypothetical protein
MNGCFVLREITRGIMPSKSTAHELARSAAEAGALVHVMRRHIQRSVVVFFLLLTVPACTSVGIAATPTTTLATMPTRPPYPDDLDVAVVQDDVIVHINDARTEQGRPALLWDDTLRDLADWQAIGVVRGAPYGKLGDSVADQLGEPVAELWTCMEDSITASDAIAQVAVERWLGKSDLRDMLLDDWLRIGVGLDWGCPDPEGGGAVVVVLLAGRPDLREG